jgi:mannosyl-oligosaccharide alpha-1,3-glucosidase
MKVHGFTSALALLLLFRPISAVKVEDFKQCSQSGFCRRGRALAERAHDNAASWSSPYSIDPTSIVISSGEAAFKASVKSSLYPEIKFGLDVRLQEDGVVRVRMDEIDGLRKRYDEAANWALVSEPEINRSIKWNVAKESISAKYGDGFEMVIEFQPLRVLLRKDGKEQIVVNGRGLLHMEHFRNKEEPVETPEGAEGEQVVMKANSVAWFEGEEPDAYWEESFSKWTDSKPKGVYLHHISASESLQK